MALFGNVTVLLKFCVACGAGLKLPLPAWLAATMQRPAAIALTVLPETLQMLGERLLKVTGSPEDAVALTVPVPPTARAGAAPKVRVWATLRIVLLKLCVACGATA